MATRAAKAVNSADDFFATTCGMDMKKVVVQGHTFNVRKLSAIQAIELEQMTKEDTSSKSALEGLVAVICYGVVDDQGKCMFDYKKDKERILEKDSQFIIALSNEVIGISGSQRAAKKK